MVQLLKSFRQSETLLEVRKAHEEMTEWRGPPLNIVLADRAGNIGYMLVSSSPRRRGDYPNLGCRVFDGTTSQHDWEGIVELKNLPFVLNPKKGFYHTANQRIVPENSKFDIGSTQVNTAQAIRISELISECISKGKKFDA